MGKVSSFLAKAFPPSFLEEKRNLIFSWGPIGCREGHQMMQELIQKVSMWVQKVNQEQTEKKDELIEAEERNVCSSCLPANDY